VPGRSAPSWRIYYDDRSTFSSGDGSPEEAPTLGVVVLNQATPDDPHHPFERHFAADWYWWRPDLGRWLSGDTHGFLDQAMNLGACWPKMGRALPDLAYQEILVGAGKDPDFWHDPDQG
jgi:hypothetical protein